MTRLTYDYLCIFVMSCLLLETTHLAAQQATEPANATENSQTAQADGDQTYAITDLSLTVDADESDQYLFTGDLPTSMDQLQSMERRFKALSEKLMPATVNIQMRSGPNGPSQGSGVVVSADGYVLTAAHVISGPNLDATVIFPDGKSFRAKTLGVNGGGIDSGMLKITDDETAFPYVNLGISDSLELGQWLMAIGHPGGFDENRGLVTRIGRLVGKDARVLRTDCTLVGGDSGGPLFDMSGNLIGIHSRIGRTLSDNFHVPVDQYSDNWDKLAQGLILNGRPYFGVDVVGDSNAIKSVNEDSPAAKAGLEPGDVILAIDDVQVADKDAIREAFADIRPNQIIVVQIQRDDEQQEFDVTISRK